MKKKRPLILITNDDGIGAPGIKKLINIAAPFGDIVVVAPDSPRSGMSHAVTVSAPLRIRKHRDEEGIQEYSCNGTPVDSVKMAVKIILPRKPDLALSGINHGSNSSINILYSGTMAAALEACMEGIPSIGFSLTDYAHHADFDASDIYVSKIIDMVIKNSLPEGVCLNVNIPAVAKEEIRGIKVCRQAKGRWVEDFDRRRDPHNREYYWLAGYFKDGDPSEDTDSYALARNYISLVPVHFDFTAHKAISKISKWKLDV